MRGIRKDVVGAAQDQGARDAVAGRLLADEYHWMDGIGPREKRPTMINTHWGGVAENNAFGTHEFMDLCEQLECEPYICGNVGSGTVRNASMVRIHDIRRQGPDGGPPRANGRGEPSSSRISVGNKMGVRRPHDGGILC